MAGGSGGHVAVGPEHSESAAMIDSTVERPLETAHERAVGAFRKLSIGIVTFELVGFWRNGGIGSVSTGLAELLASAGHDVTIGYTRADLLSQREFEQAAERYRKQGIKVVALRRAEVPQVCGPLEGFTGWERYAAYHFLSKNQFDVVHASEHLGEMFYCLAAKRLGFRFAKTDLWVGCHGPSHWVIQANDDFVRDPFWIWTDATERFCVTHADRVWAPSRYMVAWMRDHGFKCREGRDFQLQYRIPDDLADIRDAARTRQTSGDPVRELVFFGRLETRKGIRLFLDAVAELGPSLRGVRVTFMGRVGTVDGEPTDALIARRAAEMGVDWNILSNLDRREAYSYVTQTGRLVVAAAPVDKSP